MKALWDRSWQVRLGALFLLGILFGWGFSEASFWLLRDDATDREPGEVRLVIPAGTADLVAAGEASPSIPQTMTFIMGDVLVVQNDDTVDHQLGPVWVPPGQTARLTLDTANDYAYACTFQPARYLDLTVRPRVTLQTRLNAILLAGIPMGAMLAIYGLVLWPIKPQPPKPSAQAPV